MTERENKRNLRMCDLVCYYCCCVSRNLSEIYSSRGTDGTVRLFIDHRIGRLYCVFVCYHIYANGML